jgi:prenyltransferase beta subunit
MLQVARLAPSLLRDSGELVVEFIRSQQLVDGGFSDRQGESDLYYAVFAGNALLANQTTLPTETLTAYLDGFGNGAELDFVHLCSLVRCRALLGSTDADQSELLTRIEAYRAADGGYHNSKAGAERGTAYGCFLALGAYQDAGAAVLAPGRVVECLQCLSTPEGGFANEHDIPVPSTTATAGAAVALRSLGATVPEQTGDWLLARAYHDGGFFATAQAPMPDLLSTATALHALSAMGIDFAGLKEPCLSFVDTLWSSKGAFYGHWADDVLDCEYTYYGLLALGHLSL